MTRNINIDLIKGLCIFLIVLSHLMSSHLFNQVVSTFYVSLFFIIAGCYAKMNCPQTTSYSQFTKNAKRLLLPFVVTMLMLSVWGAVQALLKHNWILAVRHPLSLIWAGADSFYTDKFGLVYAGPMWFIVALFWVRELFFYIAGWIQGMFARHSDEIVVGICIILSWLVSFLKPYLPALPWCIWQALAALVMYAIGWYVHRHHMPVWIKTFCVLCWPFAIIFGGTGLESATYTIFMLDVLGACGAMLVLYYVFDWISNKLMQVWPQIYTEYQSPLQWLGVNSLAVLCMHTLEWHSGFLFSILCRLPFEVSDSVLVVVRMCLAIGLAWVVTKLPRLRKVYG